MQKLLLLVVPCLLLQVCKQRDGRSVIMEGEIAFNQELADELKAMAEMDQIAAYIPQGKYIAWSQERWDAFKDSVFTTQRLRLEEIFEAFGYPGYDLVGKDGARHFWLMAQHSDSDPEFQARVLEKLKKEVERNNADGSYFGLLTDRVRINRGEKQIYGTQVTYNSYGQAYPRDLADSVNVNKRRAEVGLEPLKEYLNRMTQMHFEMNKEYLLSKGITEPRLYRTDE